MIWFDLFVFIFVLFVEQQECVGGIFIHEIIFGVYEEKYSRCLMGSGKTIPTDTTGLRG